ncbi:MAG: cysteine dioxygenase [Flavobacteriales bacterium]|nr:MAG: cysteine dioxygenase [Flavobacteriales bacterium]
MDEIKSLNGLIKKLKQSDAEDYVKLAKNMDIPISEFSKYMHWKDDGYTRNCIIRTEAFELILICWKKNDFTLIHGHNNQKCWVYQVDGNMTEIRYQIDNNGKFHETKRIDLTPRKLTYMHDSMGYHSLENSTKHNAMSLHLYLGPVESCQVFNKESNCFEEMELTFYSVEGKKVKELI